MEISEHQADRQPEEQQHNELKQSALGIAAFVIGIISILGLLGIFLMMLSSSVPALPLDGSIPNFTEENAAEYMPLVIGGLLILLILIMSAVGLVLGIIGLAVKHRRKAFAIVGVVLNGLLLASFLLMFLSSKVMLG
ncbi:hypothetical protein [Paenibacillus sp. SYP-B4298]|uniref:hypothetical protein n=1 Tax=Paenibacillus sp. SYP-B4298 TaxID=2996034 RepID=UPI0022DDFE5B|nr:hypothetical protein [Paenibacillus sp. SYP-B4298]